MDAPLLTSPSSAVAGGEADDSRRQRSHCKTPDFQHLDTLVRIVRLENDSKFTDVDVRVVDALLQETAVATDAARALSERVEVLERALQVQRGEEEQVERPIVRRPGREEKSRGGAEGNGDGEHTEANSGKDTEDELRLQLRLVEAERDKGQRIVRDVRTFLLDEGSTSQRR